MVGTADGLVEEEIKAQSSGVKRESVKGRVEIANRPLFRVGVLNCYVIGETLVFIIAQYFISKLIFGYELPSIRIHISQVVF